MKSNYIRFYFCYNSNRFYLYFRWCNIRYPGSLRSSQFLLVDKHANHFCTCTESWKLLVEIMHSISATASITFHWCHLVWAIVPRAREQEPSTTTSTFDGRGRVHDGSDAVVRRISERPRRRLSRGRRYRAIHRRGCTWCWRVSISGS